MEIGATDVSKALRRHVTPFLRANGFEDATGRRLWRHRDGKTDHIEIASASSYRAKVDNCTTASFTVRIGISLPQYGFHNDPYHKDHIKIGPKGPRPAECQMPIRGVLCSPGSPPLRRGQWGWECRSLWEINSVDEAEAAAIDLREQLEKFGLGWIDQDWDLRQIAVLLEQQEARLFLVTADDGSHLQLNAELFGSPIREAHVVMVKEALENSD